MSKERNSNIELLRILLILMVIAHHYVVNSNIQSCYDLQHFTLRRVFMQFFGCGGKISIDAFLLISGYFMCKSHATLLKWLKLFLECVFYNVLINSIFLLAGYAPLGTGALWQGFFPYLSGLGIGKDVFMSLFLILFLLSPFLNILIDNMSKREYRFLLGILLFVYTVVSSFYLIRSADGQWSSVNQWEGIGWYCTVYLMGGYIRIHLSEHLDSLKVGIIATVSSVVLIIGSMVILNMIGARTSFLSSYFPVYGSNKILAITCAVSLFILFKNLSVRNNKIINTISSATYGVLLIHANSDTMRYLLWNKIFKNHEHYNTPIPDVVFHAFGTVIIIYVVCVCLDLLRQYFLEKPLFCQLEKIRILTEPLYSNIPGKGK